MLRTWSPPDSPKGPGGVIRFRAVPPEPGIKRAVSFVDGQNLYRHAKEAFGHHHPNYDPHKLADAVCTAKHWVNSGVRFYTGIPSAFRSPMWHGYWNRRLTAMARAGIVVTARKLRYRIERVRLVDGSVHEIPVEREKGIDLRIGLDVVRMARNGELDVAVIFSQDQDLTEVGREVRDIARNGGRWLKVVSAFPDDPNASSRRGIDGADWFPMNRELYDKCLDPRDYRPLR